MLFGRCLLLGVLCAGLTACGFQLRGTTASDLQLDNIYLRTPSLDSGIVRQLQRQLVANQVYISATASGTDYTLAISAERNARRALATTSNIGVAEYEVLTEVEIGLTHSDGTVLIPLTTLTVERTYSFDDQSLESSAEEEAELREEMRQDLVQQILRRLNTTVRSHGLSQQQSSMQLQPVLRVQAQQQSLQQPLQQPPLQHFRHQVA